MLVEKWRAVTRKSPCPVCGKPDWCIVSIDGRTCICQRIHSSKGTKSGGNIHRLDSATPVPPVRPAAAAWMSPPAGHGPAKRVDWDELQRQCRFDCPRERLDILARQLGLTAESLDRLGAGWHASRCFWTFPMKNAAGGVIGLRTRTRAGKKFAITGSDGHGLFIPTSLRADRLIICEGPTDAAAMLDMGLSAIGRPNCKGGVTYILALLGRHRFGELVVMADADGAGVEGAEQLARAARPFCPLVKIIYPPPGVRDAREWLHAGGKAADVEAAIAAAKPLKLTTKFARPRRLPRGGSMEVADEHDRNQ